MPSPQTEHFVGLLIARLRMPLTERDEHPLRQLTGYGRPVAEILHEPNSRASAPAAVMATIYLTNRT
jgi:hypothetical protein